MKTFIDPTEQFVIKIPDDWHFTADYHDGVVRKQPYGFEPYENRNAAFQISFIDNNADRKINISEQPKGKVDLDFIETEADGIKSWLTIIEGGKVLLITYVYDLETNKQQIELEIAKASESVKSLLVFNDYSKHKILPRIRWEKFMLSHAASIDLVNRAYENGSAIELVILLANQIDSVLRQSIILKKQLDEKSDFIDINLIYQKDSDRPIMEKTIYKMALDQGVLTKKTYDDLVELYGIRNKAVHRYIISDLRTDDIFQLSWSYTLIFENLSKNLISLEHRQFNEQIGIYKGDIHPGEEVTDEMTKFLIAKIKDKHGNRKLNEGISLKKQNNGG
ncbi:hypothetical protein [Carboxylicivirga sp. RSCT41]|uniref:hypothetical protein n=1 Tax=Carboxylicivirga agarovorans TaxID=3417570 RepID=UPI003D350A6B